MSEKLRIVSRFGLFNDAKMSSFSGLISLLFQKVAKLEVSALNLNRKLLFMNNKSTALKSCRTKKIKQFQLITILKIFTLKKFK